MMTGDSIGPYRVLDKLGEGGMGEVYRARDTKLQRDVALKILPDTFADDAERIARFEREARTLASLNHPHIAQVHGFEHDLSTSSGHGRYALVMELVEGEDLAERIARGAISIEDALPIARQIAEALEAAHDAGIIHRDLKPANIKVRADGTVKVLDFGLAKPGASGASGASGAAGATITSPAMTMQGMILGTAAYMSPEQAKGKPADKRSDIWAFGCVLYEMLTGARAFDGEDITDTIVAVMSREPDWARLPPGTPVAVRRLLRRSLEKKPQHRLPDVGVARLEIDEAQTPTSHEPATVAPGSRVTHPSPRWPRIALLLLGGAVLGGVTVALAARYWPSSAAPSNATRLEARVGENVALSSDLGRTMGSSVILSPDGSTLAFVGRGAKNSPQLYLRRLDQLQATPLAGTEDVRNAFFSPNGQWIAFFAGGKLKKVAVSGGATMTLADAPESRGGTWTDDDTIIFAANPLEGLSRMSADGGAVETLTRPAEGEVTHRWPHALPGARAILFETHTSRTAHDDGTIVVQTLATGERTVLQRGGYEPRYLRSGHLAYIRAATLFVVPFDIERLVVAGKPVPALQGINSNATSGFAQLSVGDNGTLIYVPGVSTSGAVPIHWLTRGDQVTPLRAEPARWFGPAFSPDGRFLLLSVLDGQQSDIWVNDIARDVMSRMTFDGGTRAIWTPDGKRITYSHVTGNTQNLYWQPADNSGKAERLTDVPLSQVAGSWHPSGKYLAVAENKLGQPPDIVIWGLESDASGTRLGHPVPFVTDSAAETQPEFSPDGRWLAYQSLESGNRFEVYVKPFPGPGGKFQVSTEGGNSPTWSRTTNELLYLSLQRQMMAVSYTADATTFRAGKPRLWANAVFAVRPITPTSFALHPDGKRIAFAREPDSESSESQETAVFVFDFFDELQRLTGRSRLR